MHLRYFIIDFPVVNELFSLHYSFKNTLSLLKYFWIFIKLK